MSKFCDKCNNCLAAVIVGETLLFKCETCFEECKATPDDSLRYEDIKEFGLSTQKKIIKKIVDDPASPSMFAICKNCKHNVSKYAKVGAEKILVKACTKCRTIWI